MEYGAWRDDRIFPNLQKQRLKYFKQTWIGRAEFGSAPVPPAGHGCIVVDFTMELNESAFGLECHVVLLYCMCVVLLNHWFATVSVGEFF
jgi:hypothetical protein